MPRSLLTTRKVRAGGINGQRRAEALPEPYLFPGGTTFNFAVPTSGRWKFVGWGVGGISGSGVSSGASAGYFEITRYLHAGDVVTVAAAMPGGGNTTVTFPDGAVATATSASGTTPGSASGGDVNLAGSAPGAAGLGTGGGAAGDGAGAPANLPYRGAKGSTTGPASAPGGGASQAATHFGGSGLVIATLVRE